jgi:hypothetical protein
VQRLQARYREYVRGSELDSEEFQDSLTFSYDSIFKSSCCTSAIHDTTQGEVKARNAASGDNHRLLGQLCLVSFYDYWSEHFRREYVVARGLLRPDDNKKTSDAAMAEHASFDLWGDIRYFRQSVVHNGGIATGDVGRCKQLKWFKPGDVICLTPAHVRELFMALLRFHNQLFAEQFPKFYLQIPGRAEDAGAEQTPPN